MYEFRLGMKTMTGQQLTLEEMKSTSIYKAYKQIDRSTRAGDISKLLGKKGKILYEGLETWYYPYGYVSIFSSENGEQGVTLKMIGFKTPYTKKLTEEELRSVFLCTSPEELAGILGESVILTESYDKTGAFFVSSYEWGIKTSLSKEIIDDLEKLYGEYVSFPHRYSSPYNFLRSIVMERKLRLHVSVKADKAIEGFSVEEYRYGRR
ncbi:MAG TPA: hypothetical protein VN580_09425 [Clostridia bacterium]|nr:hypothetical protein [Clostridia bacterium]